MGTHISPLHTRQHQSALAQWEMVLGEPDARLRGSVQSYQGYVERTPGFARRLETPSSDVVLIISLGPGLHVINPRNPAGTTDPHSTFIAGLHDSYMLTQSCGEWQGIQVNFTPIGAHLCFGVPMHEFTNRVVDLEDLFGTRAHRLVRQLYEGPSWEARFAILDTTLAARLETARIPSAEVVWSWHRLLEASGRLRISQLADELGWSQKHLIAQFHEQIGVSPKVLARILRFQGALHRLEDGDGDHWAEIALDCGYYDQAHLIRDFRAFSGLPPRELLSRRLPDGGGMVGD